MSRQTEAITLSRDEYKARRTLEEAAKRGLVKMVADDGRNGVRFEVSTPYMQGTSRQQNTKMPEIVTGKQKATINDWYQRGAPVA